MALPNPVQNSPDDTLPALLAKAHKAGNLNYAGDVSPQDAFDYLSENGGYLVDVRTLPEWQFTGVADLTATNAKLITASWKNYPDFSLNPKFVSQLVADNVSKDAPVFFLCRSGGRSLDAAVAMTAEGYSACFNIAGGFEGDPDQNGHRGHVNGWKAAKLPWKQG